MLVALFNNLPEMILGASWTGLVFWAGRRFERWRVARRERRAQVSL